MRVLLVQRFDVQNISCARRIVAFAREFSARGHTVALVNFPHEERRRSLPPLEVRLPESVEIVDLDRRGSAFLDNLRVLSARASDFDVIHLWKCYPDAALPALHAARRAGIPVHYDWDDWEADISRELTGSALVAHLVGFLERRVPRMAETVSVASAELRRQALRLGVPEDRIWDAPVGVDTDRFQPRPKAEVRPLLCKWWPEADEDTIPVLIYVGQLEVAAYAEQALAVISKLKRAVRLLIIGGGRRLKDLRTKAWSLGLTPRVAFTDYVPEDAVPDYLTLADVALAPFEDTMVTRCKSPLKVVEYMASGVPVVGSAVGEVPRMLTGCGIAVPPGDAAAMAEAVNRLLDDEQTRTDLGRQARRRAIEFFSWSHIVDNLLKAYEAAVS